MFHRSHMAWTDAKYFGDLVWRAPRLFLIDLGEAGKPNHLNAFGMGGSSIAILLDGRPLNDPLTGMFNLYDMPMEFVEQVEISTGSDGFLFGQGGTSTTLNFVTRQFNSLRPITKIRYNQSQSETILTDIFFTQNVARSLNFMVAFQRHAGDGRYGNTALDAWNLRTRLRYNISERFNISLTDFYTKSFNGFNGGVDLATTSTIYDNVAAAVRYGDATEKLTRRDVTLSMIGSFFQDSSSISQLSLFYSNNVREFNDPSLNYGRSQSSSFVGTRFTQNFVTRGGEALIGFDYQEQKSQLGDGSHVIVALFSKLAMHFGGFLAPSFFGRYEVHRAQPSLGFGASVPLTPTPGVQLFAGFNQFVSYPTLVEAYSRDTSIVRSLGAKDQRQRFAEAGLRVKPDSSVAFSLSLFQRVINDASGFLALPSSPPEYQKVVMMGPYDARIRGIAGSLMLRFWKLEGYGTLTFTDYRQADTTKTLVPQFLLTGELSYRDTFFEAALDAKAGMRSRFVSGHQGMEFIPHLHLYAENAGPRPGQFTTFDVFAILRIGDAQITLSWENVLNTNYFITPVYPMPGRNFRFGVDWIFID
ncbi:MAG: TonB-dependent receptor plug domain-containing protein [Ignavibacteriales bacterium]|nr:TonB-dependent receptor plug domain-containing protein [Ignavibacteriales bacterium]